MRKKKKKLYDGRTTVAKKFVERILKQRESRRLNKEEVELDEVLKPKDKKVIDDFVQANKGTGVQNFTQRGNIVDYEGRSLEKSGMGAQQIASIESDPKDSHKIKFLIFFLFKYSAIFLTPVSTPPIPIEGIICKHTSFFIFF